jgi:hypothetical protein
MHPAIPLLITSFLGIDVGWADLPGKPGQREYVIQIEPAVLDRLKDGETITSMIDPAAGTITHIRLQVGNGPLPRNITATISSPAAAADRTSATGPPLPSEEVLEIAESPEPTQKEDVLLLPVPTGPLPEVGPPSPVNEDRESEFTISEGVSVVEIDIPDVITGEGLDSELSPGEIEKTAALVFDDRVDDPGEFLPSLPVNEVTPPMGLVGVDMQEDVALTSESEGSVATASYSKSVTEDKRTEPHDGARPWAPLVMTILALVGSLGGNIYLGMMFAGLYRRHKQLKNQQGAEGEANSLPGQ